MKEQQTISKSLRALVVEDQAADAELLLYNIRKAGYASNADIVGTPEDFQRKLDSGEYDIIFSDYNLHGGTAIDVLKIFVRSGKNIPLIIVSGAIGDVQSVECIKNGATDYVLKDQMMPRLGIAIERAMSNFAAMRKQDETESALRASKEALVGAEDRFEKIFRFSPDANAISVLETGRFVDVNEAYTRLSGYAREDLIGKTGTEAGLWPDAGHRAVMIERLKQDGRVRHLEQEFRTKDGRLRLGAYSAELIQLGGEQYVLAVMRDITDYRYIEKRLRLSSKILNAIANLVLVSDERGKMIYASPSVKHLLGYEPADVLEDGWWIRTCSPEEGTRLQEMTAKSSRGELAIESLPADRLVKHSDGTLRCFLWQHSRSDRITITVGQDITELKEIEQALRVSQDRYRLLFDSNPQPMWVYDLETLQFLDVNEAAIQKYGYSRREFLSMSITNIRPPEEVPSLLADIEQGKKETAQDRQLVWKHQTRSGQLMDIEVASHRITLSGQQAVLVLAKDVTEQRRLQRQLQQAQKMEAVGQLAGGIAHDFNNLLGIIMGQAELLTDKLSEPTLRGRAESIVKAADRGASLTNQLLAFGRQQVLNTAVIALNELVRETVKLLGRTLGADIKVECKLDKGLWPTKVDPGQIQEVILNLAVNARDAMPKGGNLTIETFNVAQDDMDLHGVDGETGDYVCLTVADNGQGMTEEVRAKIFEPFFTTKAAGKGTGLGLAMVYGIVKQSGGQIWVYSEVGKGTVFKLYFPRTASTIKAPQIPLTRTARGMETVLVVEDQDGFREIMTDILKENGYTVLEARNGKDALGKINGYSQVIHLVISDVIMPEMSGPELAAKLQTVLPAAKILFVSGYTGDAMYRQGGFTTDAEFLQKPFTPSALARKARAVLDKDSGQVKVE